VDLPSISQEERAEIGPTLDDSVVCQQLPERDRKAAEPLERQASPAEFGHDDDEQGLRCTVQSNPSRP